MLLNGERIKELREERGWSMTQLAEEANLRNPEQAPPVTKASIWNMERGLVANPGFWNVQGIAQAFGVDPDSLFKVQA